MKKVFLILGIALTWAGLYALGLIDLASAWAVPVFFGVAIQTNYYEGTQSETHRGGWMRVVQVDNDGAVWSGATDFMGNDAGTLYELGYLDDLEVLKTESASPMKDVNGVVFGHSISQNDIMVQGSAVGTIAKYQAKSTGSAVYYADELFGSGMDRILFKAAVYFQNDTANEAATNGVMLKWVFWMGRFILTNLGMKANKDAARIQTFQFLPMALQSKSATNRAGGQIYQRRSVASLQAIASEDFETQAEVTAA